jgi:hypothetical protein
VTEQTTISPALAASQSSWRCVQARDKAGWLALMADDIVIEDPIGVAITNETGLGVRGKAAVSEFFDKNIATNNLRVECDVPVQLGPRGRAHPHPAQRLRRRVDEQDPRDLLLPPQRGSPDHEPARLLAHRGHDFRRSRRLNRAAAPTTDLRNRRPAT